MLRQILSLTSNFKNWFRHVEERQLEEKTEESGNYYQYSWPGPDQWYKGPLEIFEGLEEGSQDNKTHQTIS
jgi:hypothetical protein